MAAAVERVVRYGGKIGESRGLWGFENAFWAFAMIYEQSMFMIDGGTERAAGETRKQGLCAVVEMAGLPLVYDGSDWSRRDRAAEQCGAPYSLLCRLRYS